MPEFLAETYAPCGAPGPAAPGTAGAALGAGQAGGRRLAALGAGAVSAPAREGRAQRRPADPAGTLTFARGERTT